MMRSDRKGRGNGGPLMRYLFPGCVLALFLSLGLLSLYQFIHYPRTFVDDLIVQDVQSLRDIFVSIDKECSILGFEHQKNHIDFLTVEKFVGSEVGAMNLAYPKNWKGPYVKDNPTVQQTLYQVVKTHKGYFIVPGDGVTLGNGKTIGTDIVLDEKADIDALMRGGELLKDGKAFAASLPLESPKTMFTSLVHTASNDQHPKKRSVIYV